MPGYDYEEKHYAEGYTAVCGCDEAGRGPLCGPVVAAAVILPRGEIIEGLNDSKKLTEKKREALFDVICERAVAYAIAEASPEEIDEINILNASLLAMKRAVDALPVKADFALIDGNKSRGFDIPTETVVKGEVSGKEASLWEREYEALNDLGADSAVKKLVTEREEYVEGMGVRTNGGVWEDFPNPIRQIRPYRINLDAALIQGFYAGETDKGSPSYSFVVLNKNIAAVLTGMDADALASITSDVSVVIETDSVNVTRISLTYDMKSVALNGDNKLEDCKATLDAVYSYDLQSITLIDKK